MGLFGKKNQIDDKKADDKKSAEPKVAKKITPVATSQSKEVKVDEKPVKVVKKVSKKAVTKKEGFKSKSANAYRVLIKPIISEKATIGTSQNKYVF